MCVRACVRVCVRACVCECCVCVCVCVLKVDNFLDSVLILNKHSSFNNYLAATDRMQLSAPGKKRSQPELLLEQLLSFSKRLSTLACRRVHGHVNRPRLVGGFSFFPRYQARHFSPNILRLSNLPVEVGITVVSLFSICFIALSDQSFSSTHFALVSPRRNSSLK